MPGNQRQRKMDYLALLMGNEFKVLRGRRGINLSILTGILILSLGSISAGLGIFSNLKERMDNPYTNWVDLPVLGDYEDTIRSMQDYMSSSEKRNEYNIKNLVEYNKRFEYFFKPNLTDRHRKFMFRSLDYDEDLFKKVLEPSNLIYADPSFMQGRPDCEIMISSEVFKEMGLRWSVKEPLYLALDYNGQVMELKVAAVLKNLPDRAEFLCSSRLMYLLSANSNVDHFFTTGEKQELNYIAVKTDQEPDFKFPGLAFADYDAEEFVLNGHEKLVRYTFYFDGFLDPSKMSLIDSVLKKEYKLHCQQRLMWDCKKFGTHFIKPHYIAINFFDLRHIRKFKDELKDRFDIDLEISEVEDKENFSNVTILVSLATAGLALMGVSCFLFFIYFLISDHFEKIKQNLGTFLAFGFSKKELIRVYVRIVFWLISISLLISLLLLCILKICAFLWSGYDYLLIFHPVTIGFVLLYSLCGFIMVWWQAGKILSHAPGDLIYSRK